MGAFKVLTDQRFAHVIKAWYRWCRAAEPVWLK